MICFTLLPMWIPFACPNVLIFDREKQVVKNYEICSDPLNSFFIREQFSMNDRDTSPNGRRNKIYRTRKPKKHKKTVTNYPKI